MQHKKKKTITCLLKSSISLIKPSLYIILLFISTSIFSQNQTVSIKGTGLTIKSVFEQIEKQTGFTIAYDESILDANKRINKEIKTTKLSDVLKEILTDTRLEFVIQNKHIIIRSKNRTSRDNRLEDNSNISNEKSKKITGIVRDENGIPIPGVTVVIVGSTRGVLADPDGKYSIDVIPSESLMFSILGYENQIVEVGEREIVNVVLGEKVDELQEITVVAFGKQKKESVISSISTVNIKELKIPSSNLTTSLAGRVAGLVSYQRSGEPGLDDASFFVRGVTSFTYAAGPLILIDGVEMSSGDLARMQPDDIASFSIMKDALATSLYGARGANGVILITTKGGREGKAQISIRYETSLSSPTKNIRLADPITYMKLNNEAVLTRNPNISAPYSLSKIENTERGVNQYVYPATNWHEALFNDFAINNRFNFNVSGGGKVARYYIAGTYNQDNGVLKVDKQNNFNNNIDLRRYLLRTNVDINVTKSTEAVVRLHGTFDDYNGPIHTGSQLYQRVMRTDPVLFPAYFPPTEETINRKHILFGNYDLGQYINPYADMVRGYKEYSRSLMMSQFELKQKLDFLTEGLSIRALLSINRYSYFDVQRSYNPFYYMVGSYNRYSDTYKLANINPTSGTDYLTYREGDKEVSATTYYEAAAIYERIFNKVHNVNGLIVGTRRNFWKGNAGSLTLSLPSRNVGISGRLTYAYDSRYFTEFNFGYNGSERFAKKERFGFFPSFGLAWFITNEDFISHSFKQIISKLKLKATYGLVGNDAIGDASDRFFYLSEVNMNSSARGYVFGQEFNYGLSGVAISRYANDKITWETAKKFNLGLELELFKDLEFMIDYYFERRENILMTRADIPSTMGLHAIPQANIGAAVGSGIDFSIDYNHSFNKDFWITSRVNFTYAIAKYAKYEEVDNTLTPWLKKEGQKISQQWGYIAERLFVDEYEVINSPIQTFGEYMGGDIKYRDINNDGYITTLDRVPIGYPTQPEIIYGFGLSTGYKSFDLSCFFQGLARESFWINAVSTAPFVDTDGNSSIDSKNALLQVYADNHWSEKNRNLYALWPRLADRVIYNNTQRSTWFMQDGAFLRLKSVEVGYTIPKNKIAFLGLQNFRVYFSGTNLFTWSKFRLWDPEMAGDGLNYPIQMVSNIGLQISF